MTFTVAEIRKYILAQDSLGDVLYNLSEENIVRANEDEPDEGDWSDTSIDGYDDDDWDDDDD